MSNIPFIVSGAGTINFMFRGEQKSIDRSYRFYDQIKEAVNNNDEAAIAEIFDHDKRFRENSGGKVTCEGGVVRYNGAMVDNRLSRRILQMLDEGFNIVPLVNFMELCYQNPNRTVVDRLYDFLENNCIMIDPDGFIVGYKGIRSTGFDWWSNTVYYEVGKTTSMPREKCDEDSRNTCSASLHLGSLEYARGWVRDGKLIVGRVNPKNVTAIPEEPGAPKLRACEIEVLEDVSHLKLDEIPAVYQGFEPDDSDESEDELDDEDSEDESENDEEIMCQCEQCTQDVEGIIRDLIVDLLGFSGTIYDTSRFEEDLGADDLDLVEIAMSIEDETDVFIPEDEFPKTFGELVSLVKSRK